MKRRARPAKTKAILSGRDHEMLESIGFARYLATTQVARLHFEGRKRIAQRRLRAALDLGLVRARLQGDALHKDTVFALSEKGSRLLIDRGVDDALARAARIPEARALPHSLLIRDVLVAFLHAERVHQLELVDFLLEGDLARTDGFAAAHVVPDGLAVLRVDGREVRVALEVDLGHEPLRTLRDKLTRYEAPFTTSLVTDLVFVVTGDRRGLARLIEELGLTGRVLVFRADALPDLIARYTRTPTAPTRRAVRRASPVQPLTITNGSLDEPVGFRGPRRVLERIEARAPSSSPPRVTRRTPSNDVEVREP
ncbi:MAG: replication-relaxation family protein [Patescibacteria group bacterium]